MRWLLGSISKSALAVRTVQLRSNLGTKSLTTIASGRHYAERITVPVGSSGNVHIDLHNLAKVASTEPLLVYLPPFPKPAPLGNLEQLPEFAQGYAAAIVHYRWAEPSWGEEEDALDGKESLQRFRAGWPVPINDTLKAYDWIIENLAPEEPGRRDIYIYGSYLGATLATSFALTESYPHMRMGVRGCIAYNGIYDWTTFLPDHPINQFQPPDIYSDRPPIPRTDPVFQRLKKLTSNLFTSPKSLFDAFASPCLHFHNPQLPIPSSFDRPANTDLPENMELVHYKTRLKFPPSLSTLEIPEMMLLHDTPPMMQYQKRDKKNKTTTQKSVENSFLTQAEGLARLMRSSINKAKITDDEVWDDDMDYVGSEAATRIQVQDVGVDGAHVAAASAAWLEDRMFEGIK